MSRALLSIAALILSFLLGTLLGYNKGKRACLDNIKSDTVFITEKSVDTVYVSKGSIRDTIGPDNPYCQAVLISDTVIRDSIIVIRDTITNYEIALREYFFEDSILKAHVWANYVDTKTFRYTLKVPLVRTKINPQKVNFFSISLDKNGSVQAIDYSRLFFDRILLGAGWAPQSKAFYIRTGVAW